MAVMLTDFCATENNMLRFKIESESGLYFTGIAPSTIGIMIFPADLIAIRQDVSYLSDSFAHNHLSIPNERLTVEIAPSNEHGRGWESTIIENGNLNALYFDMKATVSK